MNYHALLLALASFASGVSLVGAMYSHNDRSFFWGQVTGCIVNLGFVAVWLALLS